MDGWMDGCSWSMLQISLNVIYRPTKLCRILYYVFFTIYISEYVEFGACATTLKSHHQWRPDTLIHHGNY